MLNQAMDDLNLLERNRAIFAYLRSRWVYEKLQGWIAPYWVTGGEVLKALPEDLQPRVLIGNYRDLEELVPCFKQLNVAQLIEKHSLDIRHGQYRIHTKAVERLNAGEDADHMVREATMLIDWRRPCNDLYRLNTADWGSR